MNPIFWVGLITCIVLSGFFSGSEMSFSSMNRVRVEGMAENGNAAAKIALYIYDHFDRALGAILIGNNLVNIAASSMATLMAITLIGESAVGAVSAIMTVTIIIFGETMPKITAKKNATRFAVLFSYPLRLIMWVLHPLVQLVVWATEGIGKLFRNEVKDDSSGAEELSTIIETVENEGVIDADRSELLQAALDFSEISARDVMTARVNVEGLDIDDSWEEQLSAIENSVYSRIPVYQDSLDNIIGILYLNHFFKALIDAPDGKVNIRSLLMKPCFVYKTVKLPSVLEELRRHKMQIAIVTDDYGGTTGIITMEDVLEEIVGDIWDETDVVEFDVIEREDGRYELDGDMNIDDFLELVERDDAGFETEADTISGWTLEGFGGFPSVGDVLERDGFRITVLKMDGLRVDHVLVEVVKK